MRWWWIRQQKPPPASAASSAGRKSAKALVRASSLAIQNWSRVCTRDAITSTRTALLSSPNRFKKVLQSNRSMWKGGGVINGREDGADRKQGESVSAGRELEWRVYSGTRRKAVHGCLVCLSDAWEHIRMQLMEGGTT